MATPRRSRLARLTAWVIGIPVAVVVVLFVVSNRQTVELALYPLPSFPWPVPVYLVGLGGLFAGFLSGGLVAWLSARRWRRRAREEARARQRAEADKAALERRLAAAERRAAAAKPAAGAAPARIEATGPDPGG